MDKIKSGFTLIELMIVISILGILAGVAIPAYQDYLLKASISSEAMLLSINIKKAILDYYAYRGKFPINNKAAGLPEPQFLQGNYVAKIEIVNGSIHITLGNNCNADCAGKSLVIQPEVMTDYPTHVSWSCKSDNITPKYLPKFCRPPV